MTMRIDKEMVSRNLVPSRTKAQELIKSKLVLCNGKIIDKTNSKVVISSSWRRTKNGMIVLKARLIEYGIKIYSVTPFISRR